MSTTPYEPVTDRRVTTLWNETYKVVSITGRVWTRAMVLAACMRDPSVKALGVSRKEVAAVLDDHEWMQRRSGEIPARVCEAAIREAYDRKPSKAATPAPERWHMVSHHGSGGTLVFARTADFYARRDDGTRWSIVWWEDPEKGSGGVLTVTEPNGWKETYTHLHASARAAKAKAKELMKAEKS